MLSSSINGDTNNGSTGQTDNLDVLFKAVDLVQKTTIPDADSFLPHPDHNYCAKPSQTSSIKPQGVPPISSKYTIFLFH